MIPPPIMPPRPPTKIRYGVTYCSLCDLAIAYCACAIRDPRDVARDEQAARDYLARFKAITSTQ